MKRSSLSGVFVVAALLLTGCGTGTGQSGPNTATETTASSYGDVVGSGEKVQSELGSYERIALKKDSPLYAYNNGESNPAAMTDAGYTAQDGTDAQHFAVDYVAREFIDSSALNGGDKAYSAWYEDTAPKYFSPTVVTEQSLKDGSGNPVISNSNGTGVPTLIHDGAPRVKSVDLKLSGFRPYADANGTNIGIKYSLTYKAAYRVDDKNAVALAAKYGKMTEEDFLASEHASPAVKDGKGENVFGASGNVNIVVGKNDQGAWKIVGFQSDTNFDTSDFARD